MYVFLNFISCSSFLKCDVMIFTRLLREQTFSPHFLILSKLFNARFISLEILNVMIIHHVYYAMTQ